jgi:hypothetical protein
MLRPAHAAHGRVRAPQFGSTGIVNNFHPEVRLDLVHKCLDRIAAAIDALFAKVLHFFLLCLHSSLAGVVNISSVASRSNAPLNKLTGPQVSEKGERRCSSLSCNIHAKKAQQSLIDLQERKTICCRGVKRMGAKKRGSQCFPVLIFKYIAK